MIRFFIAVRGHRLFQAAVITVIVISAIAAGSRTYSLPNSTVIILDVLDYSITIFFVIELLIRFGGEGRKLDFLKDGWNIFDTVIVVISLVPVGPGETIFLMRLVRIFRVLRLISAVPELRVIIDTMVLALPKLFYVCLLLFIIIYVYATFGSMVFADVDPERWSDVGTAMQTLVQIVTLSGWETVWLPIQLVFPLAWIYFFTFVFIAGVAVLNVIVAVLVDVMAGSQKKDGS